MAPTLCARPTITSVTLQPWPDGLGDHIPPRNMSWWDSWCPNLRELTVVVQSANSILENEKEMKLLTSLVVFSAWEETIGRRRLTRRRPVSPHSVRPDSHLSRSTPSIIPMSLCDHTSCLPAEILLEIFKRALPGPLRQEGRFHFQSIRSVCSEWRLISFSSPILWSSLALFDYEIEPSVSAATAAGRWLSHSGPSIPLELHLVYISYKGTPNEDYATFSNLIIRYQSRWKALLICGAGRCLWDSFNNAPSTGWTNLQKLSVWTRSLVDGSRKAGLQVLQACTSIQSTLLQHLQLFVFSEPVVRPADIGFISTMPISGRVILTMHQARVEASESSTTMITLQSLELCP
ncbi:hypothetical protein BKA70DRAFT_1444206 [Coprinopsis sp. MPI-PUGE-AT-0042]|nr:hypothetical protein BKA70DRAFT_1444206 [Coprinopsis sp. MPI-PUGE-AT-0042]